MSESLRSFQGDPDSLLLPTMLCCCDIPQVRAGKERIMNFKPPAKGVGFESHKVT